MCKCNPECRTPFCGKLGCEYPVQVDVTGFNYYVSYMYTYGVYFFGATFISIDKKIETKTDVEKLISNKIKPCIGREVHGITILGIFELQNTNDDYRIEETLCFQVCDDCGLIFGVPKYFKYFDEKRMFCPNGHTIIFRKIENLKQRLKVMTSMR